MLYGVQNKYTIMIEKYLNRAYFEHIQSHVHRMNMEKLRKKVYLERKIDIYPGYM